MPLPLPVLLLHRELLPWVVAWPPRGPDAAPGTSPRCCFPTRGADAPGAVRGCALFPSPQGSPVSGRRAVGPPRLSSRQPRIAAVMPWDRTCNLLGFLHLCLCCRPLRLPLPRRSCRVNSLGPEEKCCTWGLEPRDFGISQHRLEAQPGTHLLGCSRPPPQPAADGGN